MKSTEVVFIDMSWPYKSFPLYLLKSHDSLTYVSSDVFFKIIDCQYITRYSSGLVFRSKRLAAMRGVFGLRAGARRVQYTVACVAKLRVIIVLLFLPQSLTFVKTNRNGYDAGNAYCRE